MLLRLAYTKGTYIDTYLSLLRSSIHHTINDNESSRSKRNQRVRTGTGWIKLNRCRWMSVQTRFTLDLPYQQQKQCYDILLWQILTFLSSSVLIQPLDEILFSFPAQITAQYQKALVIIHWCRCAPTYSIEECSSLFVFNIVSYTMLVARCLYIVNIRWNALHKSE